MANNWTTIAMMYGGPSTDPTDRSRRWPFPAERWPFPDDFVAPDPVQPLLGGDAALDKLYHAISTNVTTFGWATTHTLFAVVRLLTKLLSKLNLPNAAMLVLANHELLPEKLRGLLDVDTTASTTTDTLRVAWDWLTENGKIKI